MRCVPVEGGQGPFFAMHRSYRYYEQNKIVFSVVSNVENSKNDRTIVGDV